MRKPVIIGLLTIEDNGSCEAERSVGMIGKADS